MKLIKNIRSLCFLSMCLASAYFTRGHGESSPADVNAEKGYTELRRLLEDRNLGVSDIDLGVEESIPKDAKLLIIAGPKALVLGAEKDAGFVSIFDGKTLKGWAPVSTDAKDAWVVRDGVIRGDGDKGGRCYLAYDGNKKIGNFELKFGYRLTGDKANSGVSIRGVKDTTGRRDFQCYHADLGAVGIGKQVMGAWDFHTPGRKEHRCFRGDRLVIDKNDQPTITPIEDGLKEEDIRKEGWNEVHLIAHGNHFKFIINGKLSSEFTEHLPREKRLHEGMIQLQLHNPKMIAEFRDLRLKTLD